jgi:L-threonylcarbamoyladenylate synthase
MSDASRAVAALSGGGLAVLPTDTVYGLACRADSEASARGLYRLKGRAEIQATAVIFPSVAFLLGALPAFDERTASAVHALLPGPFTLVVGDRSRRYGWLSRARPDTIGVRVPILPEPTAEIVATVGPIVATSANLPGGAEPHRLADVPAQIRERVDVEVDGGTLPGTPSTVIDLTGGAPVVLRVGAVAGDEALRRIAQAVSRPGTVQ